MIPAIPLLSKGVVLHTGNFEVMMLHSKANIYSAEH